MQKFEAGGFSSFGDTTSQNFHRKKASHSAMYHRKTGPGEGNDIP